MNDFPETRASLVANVRSPENREAWEDFVVTYRPVIYRMARRRGLQDADAQDLVQNVLMRISEAIPRYEQQPGTKFRHWLQRVARNAIFTALSYTRKDAPIGGTIAQDVLAAQTEVSADAEQELANEYQRERFLRAANVVRSDVNSETWQAFDLTVIQGISSEEAASAIGKSVGTVYAARSRIMKRLREQVAQMQESDE